METPKQKAIREAYGEYWECFKDNVNENGWIKDRDFWGSWPEGTTKIIWETTDHDNDYYDTRRPKSLIGLERNNGWISVESDLPKESGKYWVSFKSGNIDIATYNLFHNKWICSGMYFMDTRENCNIEYYQPVNRPKPRIY